MNLKKIKDDLSNDSFFRLIADKGLIGKLAKGSDMSALYDLIKNNGRVFVYRNHKSWDSLKRILCFYDSKVGKSLYFQITCGVLHTYESHLMDYAETYEEQQEFKTKLLSIPIELSFHNNYAAAFPVDEDLLKLLNEHFGGKIDDDLHAIIIEPGKFTIRDLFNDTNKLIRNFYSKRGIKIFNK